MNPAIKLASVGFAFALCWACGRDEPWSKYDLYDGPHITADDLQILSKTIDFVYEKEYWLCGPFEANKLPLIIFSQILQPSERSINILRDDQIAPLAKENFQKRNRIAFVFQNIPTNRNIRIDKNWHSRQLVSFRTSGDWEKFWGIDYYGTAGLLRLTLPGYSRFKNNACLFFTYYNGLGSSHWVLILSKSHSGWDISFHDKFGPIS